LRERGEGEGVEEVGEEMKERGRVGEEMKERGRVGEEGMRDG